MVKLSIIQTTLADYRSPLYELLRGRFGNQLTLVSSLEYFDRSVRSSEKLLGFALFAKSYYIFRRKLLIQAVPLQAWLSSECVVLELNPRIISNYPIIAVRKLLRRPTYLWGHAWPRSGINSPNTWIRRALQRFVYGGSIMYTYSDQRIVQSEIPKSRILVAPNSVTRSLDMEFNERSKRTDFIYVGRLVEGKKPALLLKAFAEFLRSKEGDFEGSLHIVGGGPEKQNLLRLAADQGISHRVEFHGHVAELGALKSLYDRAICSVSPGYVGLSVTQSLGFGVAMLVARDEPHAPEIEACEEGFTSYFFESNSPSALAESLGLAFNRRYELASRGHEIVRWCKSRYSIEAMAGAFVQAARGSDKE